jgi:hypothetical protein
MAMVSGISDVAVQEYIPQETSVETEQVKADTSGPVQVDDKGNLVVVSKDFILGLLSLAIGQPGGGHGQRLEGNLGKTVDVKV